MRAKEEKNNIVAFATIGGKQEGKKDVDKSLCTHCGKPRHTIHECFQLIGYPESWNNRGRGRGRKGGVLGRGGHRGGHHAYATMSTIGYDASGGNRGENLTTEEGKVAGFTSDQIRKLLALIESTKNSEKLAGLIQDDLIGMGELKNGVYYFKHLEEALALKSSTEKKIYELWHKRMGNMSKEVLESFSSIVGTQLFGIVKLRATLVVRLSTND